MDCARLFCTIAGDDEKDPTASKEPVSDYEKICSREIKDIRIGIDPTFGGIEPSDEVLEMIKSTVKQYESLGAKIIEINFLTKTNLMHCLM